MPLNTPRATEDRLERLREEAGRTGRVAEAGIPIVGGPIPRDAASVPRILRAADPQAPVWTWQIGLYLFVGGTSGMSGVIALASLVTGHSHEVVRAALGVAVAGALISPILLIWDLGRPTRFLNMFRVFKWRSAMSIGVWTLTFFGGFSGAAFVLIEVSALRPVAFALVGGTALSGALLATYTGVLLGATAVPVWSAHHKLLPFHFGIVGLGSAAAVLELLGFRMPALNAIGLAAATVETGVGVWLELVAKGRARAIHNGAPGLLLRIAALLTGPVPLVARIFGWVPLAAVTFLIGAVTSRYGWVFAGRVSARDPPRS